LYGFPPTRRLALGGQPAARPPVHSKHWNNGARGKGACAPLIGRGVRPGHSIQEGSRVSGNPRVHAIHLGGSAGAGWKKQGQAGQGKPMGCCQVFSASFEKPGASPRCRTGRRVPTPYLPAQIFQRNGTTKVVTFQLLDGGQAGVQSNLLTLVVNRCRCPDVVTDQRTNAPVELLTASGDTWLRIHGTGKSLSVVGQAATGSGGGCLV